MRLPTTLLLDQIGATDCESIGEGFLAQPANAISSGTYLLVGAWLVVRAISATVEERPTAIAYGVVLCSVGIGSIAFHGPMPSGARLVHDLTIAAVFAVIAARGCGRLRGWSQATVIGATAPIIAIIGLAMSISPEIGIGLSGAVGIVALGLEIYLYRTGRGRRLSRRGRRWLIAALLLLVVAGLVQVLGRTDAPLCDPDSLFQGHAMWHVMTALAFGVYGVVTFGTTAGSAE